MSVVDKIKEIEAEMARTQKNKATSYHLGTLKAKLARLRQELLVPRGGAGGSEGVGFDVAKTGVARIGFVGFPSVGKSTLMSKLTGTYSAVAEYEFTTLTTVPGVLTYKGARIQMLDRDLYDRSARQLQYALADLILLRRGNRLSITPVEPAHWRLIERMLA